MEFVLRLWLGMRSWIYFIKERYLPFYELLLYCYKTKNAIKHKFYSVLLGQRRKRELNLVRLTRLNTAFAFSKIIIATILTLRFAFNRKCHQIGGISVLAESGGFELCSIFAVYHRFFPSSIENASIMPSMICWLLKCYQAGNVFVLRRARIWN